MLFLMILPFQRLWHASFQGHCWIHRSELVDSTGELEPSQTPQPSQLFGLVLQDERLRSVHLNYFFDQHVSREGTDTDFHHFSLTSYRKGVTLLSTFYYSRKARRSYICRSQDKLPTRKGPCSYYFAVNFSFWASILLSIYFLFFFSLFHFLFYFCLDRFTQCARSTCAQHLFAHMHKALIHIGPKWHF